jgi:SAM-dependent methyltransferase
VQDDADALAAADIVLETAPCAFCGTDGGVPLLTGRDRRHGLPGRFQVVRCERCALMRTDPRPTLATIVRYYPSDYEPYRDTDPWWRRYRPLAALLDGGWTRLPARPPGRLLELGTSTGRYLQRMRQAGWTVEGVEFFEAAAREAAARTGAPVHAGDVLSALFARESFDAICAWMVIEHLHDPVTALRRTFDWLAPGGWLALSVPDAGSWMRRVFGDAWYGLDVPRHLYHFSVPTLTMVLRDCGYRDIRITRPRTTGDLWHSAIARANDRGWIARATGERLTASLPVRAMTTGAGLLAGPLRISSCLIVTARKP